MSTKILQRLGLSLNEAKIYEALLELKESSAGEVSSKTKIHRRNVYDTLNRLIDKGLVFPTLSKGENLYSPVDPDKLTEFIKEKQIDLDSILPELRAKYKARQASQEAYIYRGLEGMKNYMRDILRENKDVYSVGAKLGWFDPKLKTFRQEFFKEAKRKKIKFYSIFDAEIKAMTKDTVKELGQSYRFLSKKYSTVSGIEIFSDYVVTFTGLKPKKVSDNLAIFVLRDKNLAESYRTWFQFMFDSCPKK